MRPYLNRAFSYSKSLNSKIISYYSSASQKNIIIDPYQIKKKTVKKKQIYQKNSIKQWYDTSLQFWQNADADQKGVMLGREDLNDIDVDFSRKFLDETISKQKKFPIEASVLDCGAGIGRLSQKLLKYQFKQIDMLEKCQHFIQKAKQNSHQNNYSNFYCNGLQQFNFEHKYDCIWVQWVLIHLPDSHIQQFLKKAKSNLQQNGFIIVKENYTTNQRIIDTKDSTIIRTIYQWKSIFYSSGLLIKKQIQQPNWPSELYPVKIWLLD